MAIDFSFSFESTSAVLTSFAATYWLHSTLLLSLVWLLSRSKKLQSHFIRERAWKFAATAGVLTATVQLATGLGLCLTPETDVEPTQTSVLAKTSSASMKPETAKRHVQTTLQLVQNSLNRLSDGLPRTLTEPKSGERSKQNSKAVIGSGSAASASQGPEVTFLSTDVANLVRDGHDDESAAKSLREPREEKSLRAGEPLAADVASHLTPTWSSHTMIGLITCGWFAATIVVLVWQSVKFRWQMRHIAEAAPSHRRLLAEICSTRGIRRQVRLRKSDRFEEPVAYGLLHWTILLPAQVEKRLNREELTALLSHELAHLKRGDIVWLLVGRVLTTCLAFQPLNFLARRRWQEHAEFQCDDWAVERHVDRLTLARSLTLVAEWRAGQKSCTGVVSAAGTRFHITDRVERLVADNVPDVWRRGSRRLLTQLLAVALAATVIAFGPQTGNAERERTTPTPTSKIREPESLNRTELDSVQKDNSDEEISREILSELVREVDGLSEDVSETLAELRALEPLLAELEQRSDLAEQVMLLRLRIGLLRKLTDEKKSKSHSTVAGSGQNPNRQDAELTSGGTK